MNFDIKGVAVGAALGALTTKAMGDGYAKGAAAGAVVMLVGPWVTAKLAATMSPTAPAGPVAAAATAAAKIA